MKILKVNDRVMRVIATSMDDVVKGLPGNLGNPGVALAMSYLEDVNLGNLGDWLPDLERLMDRKEFPELCRNQTFRRFLLEKFEGMMERTLSSYVMNGAYELVLIMNEMTRMAKDERLSVFPEFVEAMRQGYRVLSKQTNDLGSGEFFMTLLKKANSIIPESIGNRNDVLQNTFYMLQTMIPHGTDPLHAMMYLQKKVRTVKDVKDMGDVKSAPVLPSVRMGEYRYWLNKALGLHVDFGFMTVDTLLYRSALSGCTATLSCPGEQPLNVPLLGTGVWSDRKGRAELPKKEGVKDIWVAGFNSGAVTVHVDQWNMDLDRDVRS